MNTKKIICIIAAGIMTLSIVSGCAKSVETTTPETAVETTTPEVTKAPEVFKASAADFDERGWKAELTLTYEEDKIVKAEYDEVTKDGKKKSEDEEYAKKMKATTKISPAEAYTKLAETALNEDKVDVVTGATEATESFKKLYEEAKAMKK